MSDFAVVAVMLVVMALIAAVLQKLAPLLGILFAFLLGSAVVFHLGRAVYHFFNPTAKQAYRDRAATSKVREEEEKRRQAAEKESEQRRQSEKRRALEEAKREAELRKQRARDADTQAEPYTYEVAQHGNESLAIRYGIANLEKKVREHWFYARGGERKRDPARDSVYFEPATSIRLQKTRRVDANLYEVLLSDFRNRPARAVIEVGTDYVKTFYPLDDDWFREHAELELTLKGNGTFTLKELATFHVQKVLRR